MENNADLILTLGYLFRNDRKEMLLGFKKEGFGKGKWNGPGGKVKAEEGEKIYSGFLREVREESGLIVKSAEKMGYLRFYFIDDPIFRMSWQWFAVDKIPFDQMWPADRYWMCYLLANKKFIGKFFYRDRDTLLGYDELREVENLDE